ncbi:DUF2793 domain-containing protein [Metapseudomonas furukawaii]|uniref:DUF2793 domain-containing protein n=1 Tax=Metapseudomonas furukawaii TaxID=1149133 RepID=UPI00227AFEAA|nr:DUF2793 domain-containing protein [Pseudomonas furukawaii]WAG76970.1 DUF2793 domain-containing protein [Pseudomonas furukawaii]
MTTPNIGLITLSNSQGQYLNANETFAILDALLGKVVKDKDLTAPPGAPADGDVYIVGPSATGLWDGHDNAITFWSEDAGEWVFITPREGWKFEPVDEDQVYRFNGTSWVAFAGGGMVNPMTTAGDIITGGASGSPQRLAAGADGKVLKMVGGAPGWGDESGGFTGGTLSNALNEAPIVTLASASTVSIGAAASNTISISGTTTIIAFDVIAAGAVRRLVFQGALTLTHHATAQILPTGASITTTAGDVAEFVSLGSGNWRCTHYLRASGAALSGGGGLSNWTDAISTASPNTPRTAASLTAAGGATNIDAVLSPKGNGAVQAHVADSNTTGGIKRGIHATDWQRYRTASTQCAYGDYAVLGGGSANTAAATYSAVLGGDQNSVSANYGAIGGGQLNLVQVQFGVVAGGKSNNSNADYSAILGGLSNTVSANYGAILGGQGNTANGPYSTVLGGWGATTRAIHGAEARASGQFSTVGDAQRMRHIMRLSSGDATQNTLTTDANAPLVGSTSNIITLPNNSAYAFLGTLVARSSTGVTSAWEFKGAIKRGANAAATALVAAVTPTVLAQDAGASTWAVAIDADTSNGALRIRLTGAASTSIKWVADVETVEVVG